MEKEDEVGVGGSLTLWGFHQDDCQENKGLADLCLIN